MVEKFNYVNMRSSTEQRNQGKYRVMMSNEIKFDAKNVSQLQLFTYQLILHFTQLTCNSLNISTYFGFVSVDAKILVQS